MMRPTPRLFAMALTACVLVCDVAMAVPLHRVRASILDAARARAASGAVSAVQVVRPTPLAGEDLDLVTSPWHGEVDVDCEKVMKSVIESDKQTTDEALAAKTYGNGNGKDLLERMQKYHAGIKNSDWKLDDSDSPAKRKTALAEAAFVVAYTGAEGYTIWNAALRAATGGNRKKKSGKFVDERLSNQIQCAARWLARIPQTKPDVLLARGVWNAAEKMKAISEAKPGDVYHERGFFSTSGSMGQARRFTNSGWVVDTEAKVDNANAPKPTKKITSPSGSQFSALLLISSPNAKLIADISGLPAEREYLLAPGGAFRVLAHYPPGYLWDLSGPSNIEVFDGKTILNAENEHADACSVRSHVILLKEITADEKDKSDADAKLIAHVHDLFGKLWATDYLSAKEKTVFDKFDSGKKCKK